MKKLILFLCILLSISFVGCKQTADEEFQKTFVDALNKRLEEVDKLKEKHKDDKKNALKEYYYEYNSIANYEYESIKIYKDKEFKDTELKNLYTKYLSYLEDSLRLYKKGYEDKLDGSDGALMTKLWLDRMNIIKTLHEKYKFNFDEKLYKKNIKEVDDYNSRQKELSVKLNDEQKKDYIKLPSYNSLVESEKDNIDKKFVTSGKVGVVHVDGEEPYFNFYAGGNYSKEMFIYYKKEILDKNLIEGKYIKVYFDYEGLATAVYSDGRESEIPSGWARYIENQ